MRVIVAGILVLLPIACGHGDGMKEDSQDRGYDYDRR